VLGISVVRALAWLPSLHFCHTLAGICPQVMAPSLPIEQKVSAHLWAGCEGPAQHGEGRLGKWPHFGLGEGQAENELQSPPHTLQVLQFAKGLREAGGGPVRTCPDAKQSVWELGSPWTHSATAPGAIPAQAGLVQSHSLTPSPQATGQAAGGAGGAPGPCQPPSHTQDSRDPASQLKPRSGQKWK